METVVLLLLAYCAPGGRKWKDETTGHPLEVKGSEKALTRAGFTSAICPKPLSDTTGGVNETLRSGDIADAI